MFDSFKEDVRKDIELRKRTLDNFMI